MTGPTSKVVPIKGGSGSGIGAGMNSGKNNGGATTTSSLAAPLARLQERCRPILQQHIQTLFDSADDALFELADRTGTNGEQNMYFESMREVRIKRRGIEHSIARDLAENFRCLSLGLTSEDGIAGSSEIDMNSLSIVDDKELEEIVAVEGMVAKAEKEFAEPLALLTARIAALLPYVVTVKTNPLGPARLCQSFYQATQSLEIDIKAKLVLFKLFDRHVIKNFGSIYDAGNRLLIEEGVLPGLKRLGPNVDRSAATGAVTSAEAEPEAEEVFRHLRQLLGHAHLDMGYSTRDQVAGLVAPGLAPALPRTELLHLLADIQQEQIAWLARQQAAVQRGVAPQQLNVFQALNNLLQQRMPNKVVSIGQVEGDAINLISMLFQFVLDDRNLAAPIKGLIARLQIPMLKVAMLDKTFFSRGGHPARKFLNEIANASLGWAPLNLAQPLERDPFYAKLESLITRIVDDFVDDIGIFQAALEDFLAFVQLDRRRASLVEQRTIDAEDGRARSEVARATVQEVLNQRVAGKRLPSVVVKLLQDGWSNVLFLICLKEGVDSDSWRGAVQTVDDLLESVSPVEGLADRTRLLRTLPTLLKNLRSGLNKIGFNPFDLNQLFSDLEQIHLQRLKKDEVGLAAVSDEKPVEVKPLPPASQVVRPDIPIVAERKPPAQTLDEVLASRQQRGDADTAATGDIADLDRELAAHFGDDDFAVGDVDGVRKNAAGESVAVADANQPEPAQAASVEMSADVTVELDPSLTREQRAIARVDALQVGNWVEFQQSGGKVLRCRLAAIIRATGKYIFVNRAGVKVAENNREGLLKSYMSGELVTLDEGRLFDRALESVIGNLREMKARNNNP